MRTANDIAQDMLKAVEAEDVAAAEVFLAEWRDNGEMPDDINKDARALGGLDRLKDRGPIVEDPNAVVREIKAALDSGSPDTARDGVVRLRQSHNAGGPAPDDEHKTLLCKQIIRRGVWEVTA
jgi:hypothetical protein